MCLFVVQSISDTVIQPNTTALLAKKACTAKKPLTLSWLGNVTHEGTAIIGGLLAMDWIQDRFDAAPPGNTCSQPLPIAPAAEISG